MTVAFPLVTARVQVVSCNYILWAVFRVRHFRSRTLQEEESVRRAAATAVQPLHTASQPRASASPPLQQTRGVIIPASQPPASASPPLQLTRGVIHAASHQPQGRLAAAREDLTVAAVQQEPGPSSAVGERSSGSNVSNIIASPESMSLFVNCMSQMFQLFNNNAPGCINPSVIPPAPVNNTVTPVNLVSVDNADNGVPRAPDVSAVWAGSSGVTATSSNANLCDTTLIGKGSGVSEACFKEALMCEVSPLGYHLSMAVKDKIHNRDYVDILTLLPNFKEIKSDKKSESERDEERKRIVSKSFFNWLQSFCIYASVLGEKHPQLCSGLFRHLEIILEAYKNFGGSAWFSYDESYRQKLAIHQTVKWGDKDVGLWLNLMLPQRNNPGRTYNQGNFRAKGICFAYNESSCKWAASCRYRHECTHCAGSHPVSKCFKKQSGQSGVKESIPKGGESSEIVKASALARGLPRPSES